ncbi:MAG: porin [Gammaproteobacteria bacterium]|nr:porin [Gammaproteobacteria bacterium]
MNKKLIAMAVATVVAAPAVSSADVSVYGRINNALEMSDNGSSNTTDISSVGSRFGIKASSDLGNGLTVSGKYEFATVTDKEQNNIADLRVGTVGISGGFGSITIGNQWSSFFNTVGTNVDPAYSLGYYLFTAAGGAYRSSNTVKYTNSFGPVYLEADIRLNESAEGADVAEGLRGDGYGIGVSVSATDNLTVAAAIDSEEGADTDRSGISARLNMGNFYGMLGHIESQVGTAAEKSQNQLWLGGTFGSTTLQLGLGTADLGGTSDASQTTLGVYHNMGGGAKVYYEGASVDDLSENSELTRHLIGLRYDF